jgi:hypothetical protein
MDTKNSHPQTVLYTDVLNTGIRQNMNIRYEVRFFPILRESTFIMPRGGGMKILRGASKYFLALNGGGGL